MSVRYKPIDWIEWLPPHLYRVGDDGTVWAWKEKQARWKQLRTVIYQGRAIIVLCHKNKQATKTVRSLILRAFVGPRPIGCEAIQIDRRDPRDNRLENLRWAPRGTSRLGLPAKKPFPRGNRLSAKLTSADIPTIFRHHREGWTLSEIATEYDVAYQTIHKILKGQKWPQVQCDRTLRKRNGCDGSRNNNAKLGEDDIPEIVRRYRAGETMRAIAASYEVKPTTISHAIHGRTWQHVDRESSPR